LVAALLGLSLAACGGEPEELSRGGDTGPDSDGYVIMASAANSPAVLVLYDEDGRRLGDGPPGTGARAFAASPSGTSVLIDRLSEDGAATRDGRPGV